MTPDFCCSIFFRHKTLLKFLSKLDAHKHSKVCSCLGLPYYMDAKITIMFSSDAILTIISKPYMEVVNALMKSVTHMECLSNNFIRLHTFRHLSSSRFAPTIAHFTPHLKRFFSKISIHSSIVHLLNSILCILSSAVLAAV